jgi:phosphatidylglycerophosphate synthase
VKWLPNAVSIIRLLLAPVVAVLVWRVLAGPDQVGSTAAVWAFWIYTGSALTDWIDGWLARTLDAKSALGAKLDLWGDKLLVALTLVALWLGWVILSAPPGSGLAAALVARPVEAVAGLVLLLATTGRDALVTRLRARAEARGISITPTFMAKTKTAVVMTGLGIILAGLALPTMLVAEVGFGVLVAGAAMSVWTGIGYFTAANRPADGD